MIAILAVFEVIGLLIVIYVVHERNRQARDRKRLRSTQGAVSVDIRQRMLSKLEQFRGLSKALLTKPHILVEDIMTQDVAVALPTRTVEDLADMMREHRTRHMIIQDESGVPVGVVSEGDVLSGGRLAQDVMSRQIISVSKKSPIWKAIAVILNKRFSCLPVIDDNVLCGIVTTTDLLMAFQCFVEYHEDHNHEDVSPSQLSRLESLASTGN